MCVRPVVMWATRSKGGTALNKRQAIAHRVWLDRFVGDEPPHQVNVPPIKDREADLLHYLAHDYRYIVELRKELDVYHARFYPTPGKVAIGQPPVCIYLIGTHLRSILAAALQDLARLRNPENSWLPATREVQRWVP